MLNKTYKLIFILTIIFFGAFLIYQSKNDIFAKLNTLKLIPLPERFTELYFANSSSLPKQVTAGQPVNFAFTIHNLEGKTTTYDYTVYLESADGERTILDSNDAILTDGEFKTFNESHLITPPLKQSKIVVGLYPQNQQIDFLINPN